MIKKGYHKMPDGSMMKNSDMKEKPAAKKTAKSTAKKKSTMVRRKAMY